ncbi:O-antigen ligase [Nocardioides exalbidus]|uniref:O-antigen ligase n=1 Tax=Nocardioides exalbidus TaxID=402596 RepID=A0A1H4MT26_9ACTN|nr:O-antigen ligase family protein [Nocardioides exalbidus]SEB85522.1 O-antigen ligase [Nocardioides exalbidus]
MRRHQTAGTAVQHVVRGARFVIDWHDSRPQARLSSPRGWIWLALIAAVFYWMSNPLVLIANFFLAMLEVTNWTIIVVVLTSPWARLPRVPWPWLAFLSLCFASQLWTINDFNTDVGDTMYLHIAVVALLVAANCEPLLVCWGLGLGGVVVVYLSVDSYRQGLPGTSNALSGGAEFTGVGTNENILAYTLMLALAAVCAAGMPRRLVGRVLWLAVIGVNACGIFLAGSGTGFVVMLSLAVTIAVVLAWPIIRERTRRELAVVLASAIGVVAVGLVAVTVLLGKDLTTFSGRSAYWRAAIETSLDTAPWLGSGWSAVWEHPWNGAAPNAVAQQIYDRAGIAFPHGHNFFFDVMPELGLAGVAVAVAMVVYAVASVRRSGLRTGRDPVAGRLVLFTMVTLLVNGITEPMLTIPLGFWTFALVVAVTRQRVLRRRDMAPPRHLASGPGDTTVHPRAGGPQSV